MSKSTRSTIGVYDCQVLAHYKFEGEQYIITLSSAEIASETKPGQFVHISVSDALPMRRPISIMLVDVENETFDLLYKSVGEGTLQLAERKIGELVSVIGPIGVGFELTDNKRPLLIGGGVGMPPVIAIAQQLQNDSSYTPFTILGSEVSFPFDEKAADNGVDYGGATHTMPLLEDWGIECRLASLQNYEGVYQGFVTDLAREYLSTLSAGELAQVEIYSCGPHPMLEAVAKLATEFNFPCQVSLEEFMACAVGGCAGCTVLVQTENGPAMKRVCVDGPVFEAQSVF